MTWLTRLMRRLRALVGRDALDRELNDEMRLHIDMEAKDLMRTQGIDPNEARRRALAAFGGITQYTEAHRDARGVRWLDETIRDARYALRSLRRSPAFTASAAAVLALGIGSSTAIFSAVDAVLISRLPYPNDDRLVRVVQQNSPTNRFGVSNADYRGIVSMQRSFEHVGAATTGEVAIAVGFAPPRRSEITSATSSFFQTLGVGIAHGRGILPQDEVQGAPNVAMLSYRFATREFNDPAAAIGKTMTIDGVVYEIVGVLPRNVIDLGGARSDIWPALQLPTPQRRGPFIMRVVGLLNEGTSREAARKDLSRISNDLAHTWATTFADTSAKLTPYPLREMMIRNAGKTLRLFAGAVGLVLLIAVANVASLMLVRVTSRAREAALRTMLGASRARLARLLVTESIIVSALGAVLGIALAWVLLKGLMVLRSSIPRLAEASLDPRAFAFAAIVAAITGILIGLYPVISVFRRELRLSLGAGDREVGASRGTQALRGALVTAQFALALPLLAGAALLINSFVRLQNVDTGFDLRRVLYVRVSLPGASYGGPENTLPFWTRAIDRVKQIPGVEHAGVGTCIPPDACDDMNNFDMADQRVPQGTPQPVAPWSAASPELFEALGVKLLEGRFFTMADDGTSQRVVLVSREWVRKYSPDRPALGRQLLDGGCETCPNTIVGIVGDVKYQGLAGDGAAVYRSANQEFLRDAYLFARTAGPPRAALAAVRSALHSLDPGLALDEAGTIDERVAVSVTPQRHWTQLLGGFAIASLILAAVGIFGMLSYLVASREREIGVRVALGARRSEVMGMIVRRGMSYAVPGALLGLIVALLARHRIESSLYDVSATDPLTLAVATTLLLGVAALACWIPAWRAAAADPVKAIRSD